MRVQVNVSDDLVAQLDEYAKAVGMSRSGLCGFFIGQGMFSLKKSLELAADAIQSYTKSVEPMTREQVEQMCVSSLGDVMKK